MGQKIHPFIFRVILNRDWNSLWYVKRSNFSTFLLEDIKIRKSIYNFFKKVCISRIIIQKFFNNVNIRIFVKDKFFVENNEKFKISVLKMELSKYVKKNIYINIFQVKNPKLDPVFIFYDIKEKIEFKKPYKNFIKIIIEEAFKAKALGVKIIIQGRSSGSTMSKKQTFKKGKIPLHKIISNIHYFNGFVKTNYGVIGVKVWVYLGDFIYL